MIDEELEGAKCYAEKYVDFKAQGKNEWANKFKTMAADELSHATILHDVATAEINQLKTVYTAPPAMQEAWDRSHVEYVDKAAWVKQMLTM